MRLRLAICWLLLAACGDSSTTPAVAPPGRFEELSSLALPPRCDRVRVAVRAFHDAMLDPDRSRTAMPRVLDALDALSKARGGADPGGLAPLVAAWRAWTPEQIAAEKDLEKRYRSCVDALRAPKISAAAVAAPLGDASDAPPKSPAAAGLTMVRAAVLV